MAGTERRVHLVDDDEAIRRSASIQQRLTLYPGCGRWLGEPAALHRGGANRSDRPRLGFTNQYAAMPSLHVGWDLLMGYALVVYGRRRWQRVAGVLLPLMMMVAVVATGNHYVVDAVAGVVLVLASLLLVRYVQARLARRSRRTHGPSRSVPTQRESPGHEPLSSQAQVYDRR